MHSDYKINKDKNIERHLKNLIRNLAGKDEYDEGYQKISKYVNLALTNHRFLDTDKFKIIREINGISEKFKIHNQEKKNKRLDILIKAFLQKKLKNHTPDIHYSVLSLFLSLSHNPLELNYFEQLSKKNNPVDFLEKPSRDAFNTNQMNLVQSKEARESEEAIFREWGAFEPSSEDDDEMEVIRIEEKQAKSLIVIKQGPQAALSNSNRNDLDALQKSKLKTSLINKSTYFGGLPITPLYDSTQEQFSTNNSQSLAPQPSYPQNLSKKRTFEKFLEGTRQTHGLEDLQSTFNTDKSFLNQTYNMKNSVLNPNALSESFRSFVANREEKERGKNFSLMLNHWLFEETTERSLVQDTILMLGGMPSKTFLLKVDPERKSNMIFDLAKLVEVKHLTPDTLTLTLNNFLEFGNILQGVRDGLTILSDIDGGLVLQSLILYSREYLMGFTQHLEVIQLIFLSQSHQVKTNEIEKSVPEDFKNILDEPITLMRLWKIIIKEYRACCNLLLSILENMEAIFRSCQEIQLSNDMFEEGGANSKIFPLNSIISTKILSYLYFLMTEECSYENVEKSCGKFLVGLFWNSFKPYLKILSDWLQFGILCDEKSEFLIRYTKNYKEILHPDVKIDWIKDFQFQFFKKIDKVTYDKFMAVPAFLSKYASKIMNVGKSVRLISYILTANKSEDAGCQKPHEIFSIRDELIHKLREIMNGIAINDPDDSYDIMKNERSTGGINRKISTFSEKIGKIKEQNIENNCREFLPASDKKAAQPMEIERMSDFDKTFPLLMEGLSIQDNPFEIFSRNKDFAALQIPTFDLKLLKEPLSPLEKVASEADSMIQGLISDEIQLSNNEKIIKNKLLNEKSDAHQRDLMQFKLIFDLAFKHSFLRLERLVNDEVSKIIFEGFHLEEYLACLRAVYFFEKSAVMEPLSNELIEKTNTFGAFISNHTINSMTKDIVQTLRKRNFRNISDNFSIEWETKLPQGNSKKSLDTKDFILKYKFPYPLDIIFDEDNLVLYNKIFKFLLVIRRARHSLVSKNFVLKKSKELLCSQEKHRKEESFMDYSYNQEEEGSFTEKDRREERREESSRKLKGLKHRLCIIQKELLSFIDNLEYFVMTNIVHKLTKNFLRELKEARGLLEIMTKHREYLQRVHEICLQNPNEEKYLHIINTMMDSCREFLNFMNRLESIEIDDDSFIKSIDDIKCETDNIMEKFKISNKLLLKILQQHKEKGRNSPFIELLTKMNFNWYYINENGEYGEKI